MLLKIKQDTRTHVVGELYDTERSYVESLQILVEVSFSPSFLFPSHKKLNFNSAHLLPLEPKITN